MINQTLALLSALGPVMTVPAYAEVFMNDEQAAKVIFPGIAFEKKTITLAPPDKEKIESESHERVRGDSLRYFKSKDGSVVFIDQVLGKHEFITMAVGITPAGKVHGVEILEYRESYGQGVCKADWRRQFIDKDKDSVLKVDKDIKNISGATLSSAHVTGGVRRLLRTYDQLKTQL